MKLMSKTKVKTKIKIRVLHPDIKRPLKKTLRASATLKDILGDNAFKDIVPPEAKVLVVHEPTADMPLPDNATLIVVPEKESGLSLFIKRVKDFWSVEPY